MTYGNIVVARSYLGLHEDPPGSNHQPFSAHWHHPDEPWCADFACFCLEKAGMLDVPMSSYTPTLYQNYVNAGRSGHTPKIGALGFCQWPGSNRIEHVITIEGIADANHVISLEGNTTTQAAGSQRNGGEVARKVRSTSLIVGYGYPKAILSPPPAPVKPAGAPTWFVRNLGRGMTGGDVRHVQHALKVPLTNAFDHATEVAVRSFRAAHHEDLSHGNIVDAAMAKALG